MKKYILALFILLILLPITAYAHSGRTDSSGGHYDHTTGEYHWHHGEDEHQHRDMDGDGDLDCPLNFRNWEIPSPTDAKTDTIPEWTFEAFPEIKTIPSLPSAEPSNQPPIREATESAKTEPLDILGWIGLLLIPICAIVYFRIR